MLVRSVLAALALFQCLPVSLAYAQVADPPAAPTAVGQGPSMGAVSEPDVAVSISDTVPPAADLVLRSRSIVEPTAGQEPGPTLRVRPDSNLRVDRHALLPPLVAVISGALVTGAGVGLGVVPTLVCEGDCAIGDMAGPTVVTGALVVAIALVWLDWVVEARAEARRGSVRAGLPFGSRIAF